MGTSGLPGELQGILDDIRAVIHHVDTKENAVAINVAAQVATLKNDPAITVPVYGAHYDVATGVVTWL